MHTLGPASRGAGRDALAADSLGHRGGRVPFYVRRGRGRRPTRLPPAIDDDADGGSLGSEHPVGELLGVARQLPPRGWEVVGCESPLDRLHQRGLAGHIRRGGGRRGSGGDRSGAVGRAWRCGRCRRGGFSANAWLGWCDALNRHRFGGLCLRGRRRERIDLGSGYGCTCCGAAAARLALLRSPLLLGGVSNHGRGVGGLHKHLRGALGPRPQRDEGSGRQRSTQRPPDPTAAGLGLIIVRRRGWRLDTRTRVATVDTRKHALPHAIERCRRGALLQTRRGDQASLVAFDFIHGDPQG